MIPEGSSATAVTVRWANCYDKCSRVRGEHLLWGGRSAPPRRRRAARRRTTALYRAAVPGARDGQELDLPAPAQRGAPKREAGAHHQGKARGVRTIPPE